MRLFRLVAVLGLLLLPCVSRAQVTSDGVSVRNSDPQNVFFMFPTGPDDNIVEIQMSCSTAAVNRNYVFVYELQPDGMIKSYPFQVAVNCNIHFSDPNHTDDVFTGSLENPITVQTADHTVTISTAAWTAALKAGRHGYYWGATGGQAQITVGDVQSGLFYPCGSKRKDCLRQGD